MKALILAAGKGTRMMPLTQDTPKVMVMVNNQPFLYYVFETLRQAGITKYCTVVGYKYNKILEFFTQQFLTQQGVWTDIVFQTEQKGTGDAVQKADPYVHTEDFIVISGDNLFHPEDIKSLVDAAPGNYITGVWSETPERYGVLDVQDSKLTRVIEKPKVAPSNYVNAGLYRFTFDILDALTQITLSERGELELTDAVNILAEQGKMHVHTLRHFWQDFGCPEDVLLMEERIKSIQL